MFGLLGGLALGAMNMLSNQSSIRAQQTAQANANAQNDRQFAASFNESVRQYNQNYDTSIQQYNKTFNENVRQYNQNYKFSQSQLAFERQQQAYQEALNRNRIQWAIEDAQKAGLHPMAALGLGAGSFSPISTSSVGAVPVSPGSLPGNAGLPSAGTYESVGGGPDWVADMGQNLAYAAAKAKDRKEQEEALVYLKELQGEQLKSVKLDNELKSAQVLSQLQQLRNSGPAAPSPNGKLGGLIEGQDDSFASGVTPLLGLSRVGNTLMAHINPDVSDSITEDMVRTQLANLNAEFQAGRLTPEVATRLSENEKRMLARGDAVLEYSPPSTWRFRLTPKMRPKYSKDGKNVSGKLNFSKLSY